MTFTVKIGGCAEYACFGWAALSYLQIAESGTSASAD